MNIIRTILRGAHAARVRRELEVQAKGSGLFGILARVRLEDIDRIANSNMDWKLRVKLLNDNIYLQMMENCFRPIDINEYGFHKK